MKYKTFSKTIFWVMVGFSMSCSAPFQKKSSEKHSPGIATKFEKLSYNAASSKSSSEVVEFAEVQQSSSTFHQFFLKSPFRHPVGDGSQQIHQYGFQLPQSHSQNRWGTIWPESHVFAGYLRHHWKGPQLGSFELGIGKGGQGYSLLVDWHGKPTELFPPQWQASADAPWIDEILQVVAVDLDKRKDNPPSFSHQAGTYFRDGQSKPFYSPRLAFGKGPYLNSIVSVNWAQQAHVPHNFKSNLITYAMYRSVGNGIIEVSYSIYNFSNETVTDRFNLPWMAVRTSELPQAHMSVNGRYHPMNWRFGGEPIFKVNNTDGFMIFSRQPPSSENKNLTLAVVFGNRAGDDTDWRGGRAGDSDENSGVNNRNTTVGTMRKHQTLEMGETMFFRFYMVVGPLKRVEAQIKEQGLNNKVEYRIEKISKEQSPTIVWSYNGRELINGSGEQPIVLRVHPFEKSYPVFLIEGATGELLSTTNPYLDNPNDEYIRNYRSHFKVKRLLGYSENHFHVRYR